MSRLELIDSFEGQEPLFFNGPTAERPDLTIAPEAEIGLDQSEGVSVDIVEYYRGIAGVLKIFGNMNKSENFIRRFEEGSPIVKSFKSQYQSFPGGHEGKLIDSRDKLAEMSVAAHDSFAKPFGRDEIVRSGQKSKRAVEISKEKTFQQLRLAYSGIENATERQKYLGKIERRVKRFQKIQDALNASDIGEAA